MSSERTKPETPANQIAVLDTSVLFPAVLRDTLLRLASDELYIPVWSATILDELERTLVREHRSSAPAAARLVHQMRAVFPKATTALASEPMRISLPDPDDEHVLRAALGAGAGLVVTANVRHFPERILAPFGVGVATPDAFLLSLRTSYADRIVEVIQEQAADLRRPSVAPRDVALGLASHAPDFASWLQTALSLRRTD